jgi:enolase
MTIIESLSALEILDSRGRPTVLATCTLRDGVTASASVPSGASTGAAEALELRDGDPKRYRGLGCRNAVRNITGVILPHLRGKSFDSQEQLDRALLDLDATPNKSRLGANAILAVSLAFARAHALSLNIPLYQHLSTILGIPPRRLPRLTINLFSGGKHAGGQIPIQDVLVVPVSAKTIDDGLAHTYAVYQAAADLCVRRYNTRPLKADEGGLAPPFDSAESALADAVQSIRDAGFTPGRDIALAVDVASTHFYRDNRYHLGHDALDSRAMIARLSAWLDNFPIISLEDGLAEDDWQHWPELRQRVSARALVLGDDFLCTNPTRIRRAIDSNCANALLIKVNQIGTLTEAAESYRLAKTANWHVTISARSGETEDNWLADLAVGWNADHIKIGSITQSERLAKYNRLLQIEREINLPLA